MAIAMPKKRLFPALYGKSSKGRIKVWKIAVTGLMDGTANIVTTHGYEDGKQQEAVVHIEEGKNIGRANATTPYSQACSEAESKWNKKKDKKYFESKEELNKPQLPLPMLAFDYKKRGSDIEYPAYTQPKLNGIRCLASVGHDEVSYRSREGKLFSVLDHLTAHLLKLGHKGIILDGELFSRRLTFQEISSAVKRMQLDTLKLEFWIYDIILDMSFAERYGVLTSLDLSNPLILVPTIVVKTEKGMLKLHDGFTKAKYEGTIVRNMAGLYKADYRSADLQKYKDFVDDEFRIIGAKDGEGKDRGAVTWICVTKGGEEFPCVPNGTYPERRVWWIHRTDYLGKMLTVRYQNLSDNRKVPVFPKGIGIREGSFDAAGKFTPDF